MCVNTAANARMFGNGAAKPCEILSGAVRSPHEFQVKSTPPAAPIFFISAHYHACVIRLGHRASCAPAQCVGSLPNAASPSRHAKMSGVF